MSNKDENMLDLIPSVICQFEESGKGIISLVLPRFKIKWIRKMSAKLGRSEFVKIHLDERGSQTWQLIDGKRTVQEIGSHLEKDGEESDQQFYERLSLFIGTLKRNGWLRLQGSNS